MIKKALGCTLLLSAACALSAAAGNKNGGLNFNGGIGVHPLSDVTGCPGTPAAPADCLTDPDSDNAISNLANSESQYSSRRAPRWPDMGDQQPHCHGAIGWKNHGQWKRVGFGWWE
jgi:hypothetical protein